MSFTITSTEAGARLAKQLQTQARRMLPATRLWGEFIARKARRQAPVGKGRGRGSLKRSLGHREPGDNVTALISDRVYAKLQDEGGTVTAGSGRLGARLLAIPLNDTAQRTLDSMGASQSLRMHNLFFLKSRRGRMFLVQQLQEGSGARRGKRTRGRKRQHRMHDGQILFMLVPRVTIKGHRYVPRVSDADVMEAGAKFLRKHLRGEL